MKSILRNSQNYWRKKQRSQTSNSQNRKRFSQMIRLNKKIDQQNIIIGRRLHTVHSEYQGISTLYLKNPSSHNQFLKVSSLNRSRPLSGRTTLKVKTVENNAVGDLDNQFINTQNFNPIYKQQKKQRCQTAIRKKIYTQNTQQS